MTGLFDFSKFTSVLKLWMVMTVIFACLCSCGISSNMEEPRILRDLIYTEDKQENQYTVWIEESGGYVPYLVLTDQYSEQKTCLLLRKNAIDQLRIFHRNGSYASYYPDSDIDQYLNNEFLLTLPKGLCDMLCNSEIAITKKSSLGYCGKDMEIIQRKIFLLSAVEVGGQTSATMPCEGKKLSYFSSNERRSTHTSSGVVTGWWLRTPNTWHDNVIYGVNTEGVIGIGGVGGFGEDYLNGVRPAFCLKGNTQIQRKRDLWYLVIE